MTLARLTSGSALLGMALLACHRAVPLERDSAPSLAKGDTAISPPPLVTPAPEMRDTAIWLVSEFSGRSAEVSITTPDHRMFADSTPLGGPSAPAPERPDTNPLEGSCDCPEGKLFATQVPPGTAWLQARGIDDGEVTLSLQANSGRSNRTGWWPGAHAVLKKDEIRRWKIRVPTSAHPESLTVVSDSLR